MAAMIFFLSGRPHLANHPPPLALSTFVHICPLLADPPLSPNVQTSFMDGPFLQPLFPMWVQSETSVTILC